MIPYLKEFIAEASSPVRVIVIVAVMAGLHLTVVLIRRLSNKLMTSRFSFKLSKSKTIATLSTSAMVFVLYFSAGGLILNEFGVSLKAYLASASILGLAIGFGSQGLVQDVVNGLTIVFSDLFNVGDMVEISGQTGIVRSFGMRFTVLENSLGAKVYIPNRTITNAVRYSRGYVRCLADITLPGDPEIAKRAEEKVVSVASAIYEQLPGILLTAPSVEGRVKTRSGKEFLRIKFRLWPGRGDPIEEGFKQEIVAALKTLDPNYEDWMVTVNYEAERKPESI